MLTIKRLYYSLIFTILAVGINVYAEQPLLSNLYELEQLTSALKIKIPSASLPELAPDFEKLKILKDQVGLNSYENFSLLLVAEASKNYEKKDISRADFFIRKALVFSPLSPRVLLSSFSLATKLNISSPIPHLLKAFISIFRSREFLVSLVGSAIYPLLVVSTITTFFIVLLFIISKLGVMLQSLSRVFPLQCRGLLTPVALTFLIIGPLFFGPLFTLLLWAMTAKFLIEKSNWVVKPVGVIFLIWGLLIPIKDTLEIWRTDESGKAFLRAVSGDFTTSDRHNLEKLAVKKDTDGLVWFLYGQMLRKYGNVNEAREALNRAEKNLGEQSWIVAEKGNVALASGDFILAKDLYTQAKELGLESASLAFNQSRIALEELDTANARSYMAEAQKLDPDLVTLMKERESVTNSEKSLVLADVSVPTRLVFETILSQNEKLSSSSKSVETVGGVLFPFGSSLIFISIGIVLLVISFVKPKANPTKRTQHYFGYYEPSTLLRLFVCFIPGGPWIMAKRFIIGFISAWIIWGIGFFLIGWPHDARSLQELMPDSTQAITIAGALIIALIMLSGIAFAEEK